MKLNEVLSWKAPATKLKKLSFLTPEIMAKHHDEMVNIIGTKLSHDDISELEAELSGGALDQEDLEFQLNLIRKAIAPLVDTAEVLSSGNGYRVAQGAFEISQESFTRMNYVQKTAYVNAHHSRGKWKVSTSSAEGVAALHDKKVDTAAEVISIMKAWIEKAKQKNPLSKVGQQVIR